MKYFRFGPLALCLAGSFLFAQNPTIQNLPPDTWLEVPNTHMRNVGITCQDYSGICGSNNLGPNGAMQAVVSNWSGGTFDTRRNRLIVWGGGHKAYGGNEIYAFSLNTLTWERITEPGPPQECLSTLADGTPNSRHTYGSLAYLSSSDKLFAGPVGGIYCLSSKGDGNTWTFDFQSKKWMKMQPGGPAAGGFSVGSAYDPVNNQVYYAGSGVKALRRYDVGTNSWTLLSSINTYNVGETVLVYEPIRKLLVRLGGGYGYNYVAKWDIGNNNFNPVKVNHSGSDPAVTGGAPGAVFDPVIKKIVAWNGGAIHVLDLDNGVWQKKAVSPQGANEATNAPLTYGRFQYSPLENCYVAVNHVDKNVLIYKLTTGGGTVSTEKQKGPGSGPVVQVSPNPFNAKTTISVSGIGERKVKIFNTQGKLVKSFLSSPAGVLTWEASNFPPGVYLLKVRAHGRNVVRRLFLTN